MELKIKGPFLMGRKWGKRKFHCLKKLTGKELKIARRVIGKWLIVSSPKDDLPVFMQELVQMLINKPVSKKERGEKRKKNTSEVSEQSKAPKKDSEKHGGDGNSQECDSKSKTSSEESKPQGNDGVKKSEKGNSDNGNKGEGKGEGKESPNKSPDCKNGGQNGQGKGEGKDSPKIPESDGGQGKGQGVGSPKDLSKISDDLLQELKKNEAKRIRKKNLDQSYGRPRVMRGKPKGEKSSGKKALSFKQLTQRYGRKEVRTLKKSLERLFKGLLDQASDDLDGVLESPRIDGRKFIIEKISKRWNLSRLRKEELASKPKKIIVAADASGSCSSSSGATVGMCEALTKVWPELIFVNHANGQIFEITEKGVTKNVGKGLHCDAGYEWSKKKWLELSSNCVGALFFGDADGFDIWSVVWRNNNVPAIWLDSYCASYGEVKQKDFSRVYGYIANTAKDSKVQYFVGVNDFHSTWIALKKAKKI